MKPIIIGNRSHFIMRLVPWYAEKESKAPRNDLDNKILNIDFSWLCAEIHFSERRHGLFV
jgi:hypothetical protein